MTNSSKFVSPLQNPFLLGILLCTLFPQSVFCALEEPLPPFEFQIPQGWTLARAAYRCGKPYWIYAPGKPQDHLALERKSREREALFRIASLKISRSYGRPDRGPKYLADELVKLGQMRKIQYMISRKEAIHNARLRRDDGKKCMSHWVRPLLPFKALDMQAIYQELPTKKGQLKTLDHIFTFDGKYIWRVTYEGTGEDYDKHIDVIVQALQTLSFPKEQKK